MKYARLTWEYAGWLFPLIDRHDGGVKIDGIPRSMNSNQALNAWEMPNGYPPRKLTKTHLQSHVDNEDTYYYRSNRRSGFALLMIDIDAHDGQIDAPQVAEWLVERFLPGAYYEPSTGGKGVHVYSLFRTGSASATNTNKYLKLVGGSMAKLVSGEGFAAKVCGIYGTPTEWGRDSVTRRGSMGKLPRLPDGHASLSGLIASPVVLNLDEVLRAGSPATPSTLRSRSASVPCPTPIVTVVAPAYVVCTGPIRRAKLFRSLMLQNPDTTEDEFVAAYQVLTPENNRDPEHARKDYRRMKEKFVIRQNRLDLGKYKTLVASLVPPTAYQWDRRETVNGERLAEFVAVKVHDALTWKYKAGRDATIRHFRAMKEEKRVEWVCTQHQYTKLLQIACEHGLLKVYEDYTRPIRNRRGEVVFKGLARVIGPGPALPQEQTRFMGHYRKWQSEQVVRRCA